MTLQGPGGEPGDPGPGPADDETRTDWSGMEPASTPEAAATPEPAAAPELTAAPEPAAPIPSTPPPPPGVGAPPPADAPPPVPPPAPAQPPVYGARPPAYGPPPAAHGAPEPGQPAPVAWAPPEVVAAPTGLEVPGAPGLRFGSVWHRFIAYLLDGLIVGIGAGILAGIAGALAGGSLVNVITMVIFLGAEFLYFVGFWTGGSRATLGMRVMKLQIGQAFDGRTLTIQQAVIRWVALGLPFQALAYVPELAAISGLAGLWSLVLLISTAISPTRQGIHDRLANSAIVQPVGASTPAAACLILLLLFVLVPIVLIISLIFLGSQVSDILVESGAFIRP